ncbi:MAG: hypothetical protein JSU72_16555, partial [Deltaproteobacteria bacterium]
CPACPELVAGGLSRGAEPKEHPRTPGRKAISLVAVGHSWNTQVSRLYPTEQETSFRAPPLRA